MAESDMVWGEEAALTGGVVWKILEYIYECMKTTIARGKFNTPYS
jgi:hypothetical protein